MKKIFVYIAGFIVSFIPIPGKIKDLIMWPIASRVLGSDYRQVVRLKDGFRMHGSMEDILSRLILFRGRWKRNIWEPETSKTIEGLSANTENVVIAGSHIGYLVLKAALHTKGRVHAFEPVQKLFESSKDNFTLNPELSGKIVLSRAALGAKSGLMDMYVEDIRSSAFAWSGGHVKHGNRESVPVTTLDEYARDKGIDRFDVILLDVEGYEWFVLDGSTKMLSKKPILILEVSPRILSHTEITPEMMEKRLTDLGYEMTFLDKDEDYANIYAK